ncbi:MAG TPA: protein usg, partial [Candidatus Paceibacterota bacterium]|nr:protein usg [Candidatus Paceibacterota bacterium]
MSRSAQVSPEFSKMVQGYGLTTAQILYRMPDHQSILQTYIWQDYDLFPKFPALHDFLAFWEEKLEGPL